MHRIRRKSVYHRKYHIQNVLNRISFENDVCLNHKQREQIHELFVEIDGVLCEVGEGRKRMISIKYNITQLFKMFGLPQFNEVEEDIKILSKILGKDSIIDRR